MSATQGFPAALPSRGLRLAGGRALRSVARRVEGLFRFTVILSTLPLLAAALLLGLSMLRPPWLAVRNVALRGCEITGPAELLSSLPWQPGSSAALLPALFRPHDYSSLPWVVRVSLRPAGLRSVIAELEERHPIARAQFEGKRYWVCDDGALVEVNRRRDAALVPLLKDVPLIEISGRTVPAAGALTALADAAVACKLDTPGQIRGLRYTAEGQVELTHACGMYIRMGGIDGLHQRMAALPKVLRSCAEERAELRGIDASDSCVFYKEWRSAPPQVQP